MPVIEQNPPPTKHAVFGRRFARHLWRLTRVYWTSPDGKMGALLYAVCMALELATVYASVRLAVAQGRVFNALQARQATAFFDAVGIFLALALAFVLVSTYRIYIRQGLQMRWRHWLTGHYLEEWVGSQAYCQMELHRKELDNPDQRISEDIGNYVASALGLSLSLISAFATLFSFGGLLWSLSQGWGITLRASEIRIPGLMLWVAVAYALLSTVLTHLVGRPLVPINFNRQRVEADFRYGLVRFRENVEAVAFARGEARERRSALDRFKFIIENWWQLIRAQRNVTILTTGVGEVNSVVPLMVAAPAFIAGRLTLGGLTEIQIAYGSVSGALVWFVNAYQEIAAWRASIERLSTFAEVIDTTRVDLGAAAGIAVTEAASPVLHLADLEVDLPDGRVLFDGANARVAPQDRVVLTGPSGIGKTTLFRSIAGIWPFGHGQIEVPAEARAFFLPQQPYLPIGTLREAMAYPAPADSFADAKVREALRLVGLGNLEDRLDQPAHWEQQLSVGEQQLLNFGRLLLHEPEWIFLDESTASLDEAMEKRVYELVGERLPRVTMISVAHRPAVMQYHSRRWTMAPGKNGRAALQTD